MNMKLSACVVILVIRHYVYIGFSVHIQIKFYYMQWVFKHLCIRRSPSYNSDCTTIGT